MYSKVGEFYLEVALIRFVLERLRLQTFHTAQQFVQQTADFVLVGGRVQNQRILRLLFHLLHLLTQLGDVLVQMRAELVDVGVPFRQRFVDGVLHVDDRRTQRL